MSFTSPGATLAEDAGSVQVDVRIDLRYTKPVVIPYTLLGDAVEGEDFIISPPSPLVLAAGERQVTLTVTSLVDSVREADELVRIRLGKPDWAGLEKPRRFDLVLANDDCIVPEDFNDCAGLVGEPWSFLDVGDGGSAGVSGVGTDDAWLNLSVQAGSDHLPLGTALPSRALQAVVDGECMLGTRIESEFTADGQYQGFLLEQDDAEWMRFEVYSGGGGARVFLGSTTGGVTTPIFDGPIPGPAPYFLKSRRAGDFWLFSWSRDGLVWTDLPVHNQALILNQVGLYAGNSGGAAAPAHTASFDWFDDLDDPLTTEDGPFSGSGPFTLTTQVVGGGQVLVDPLQATYTCSDFVTLTAVADPGWVFDFWQDDLTGTENPQTIQMTADKLATAVFLADPNPPVISNRQVLATSTTALVTWDTDEPATSFVEWGPTAGYGDSLSDGAYVTSHALLITGLTPGSEVHYRVCSTDLAQNTACSSDDVFSTSILSEDFNDCTDLSAPWSFLEPGDVTLDFSGAGTSDAWADLIVPSGTAHLPEGGVLGARLAQPVADPDLAFVTKIESELTADGQHQGVLLEQDAAEWLRFEVYSVAGGVSAFLGSTTGGVTTPVFDAPIAATAPYWLRTIRTGDDFVFGWSDDGVIWNDLPLHTQVLDLAQVGLYGGNSGAAPAHTASFDYVEDLAEPLVTEDGPFSGSGPFTLTTVVSPSAAETAGCFITVDPVQATYTCSDEVTLTAVAAPGWVFDFWQDDLTGTENPQTIQMTADRLATAVFLSDPNPPVISNLQVLATSTTALVVWDTDEPATSFVEWGPTAGYGNSLFDGTLVTAHAMLVTGLTPGTEYHYRVCSTDPAQNTACSPDDVFSTSILSEDFNDCTDLSAPWSFVDPIGDATLDFSGAGTSDAWATVAVPAGTAHLPDGGVLAARIVQPVLDPDLAFVTKIESELTADGQHQGVLLEQDAAEWLRFEVYSVAGGASAFLGSTTGGVTTPVFDAPIAATAPYWLRTIRTGDDFVFGWSDDGVVWNDLPLHTQVLDLAQVGLYAGNSGAVPAHTAAFDYVEDLAEPLVTEDGPFSGSGPFTLTTNVTGNGQILVDPLQATYTCSDEVTLTAVPDIGWAFSVWQDDLTGSTNPEVLQMSADRTVTAVFVDVPPDITDVQVSATVTTATVTWTTSEPADSLVEYGLDAGYGSSVFDGALVTSHQLDLTGLTPGTLYHFRVCSTDAGANTTCTADATFTTAPGSGLVSDDFNRCEGLAGSPWWTFLDPIQDGGAAQIVGVGTVDAWLQLFVPGGSTHVPIDGSLPARVVQAANDEDLAFEVQFDSSLDTPTQIQGVTIEQDGLNWIRFDVYRNGSGTFALVGDTVGGVTSFVANVAFDTTPPVRLRVTRTVDAWLLEAYDAQAAGWTTIHAYSRAMIVTQVGVYAGNSGGASAPAFVANVDWFENLETPLASEDGPFAGSGPFTLTVNVIGMGSVEKSPDKADYSCVDVVTLTASEDPGWDFSGWGGDLGGSQNPETIQMSADRVVDAIFVEDSTPPIISNVVVTAGPTSALVTWDTNEPATSRVDYGFTSGYGSFEESLALVTSHAIQLTGLSSNTLYHFQVSSVDDAGLSDIEPDDVFQTDAQWSAVSDDFNQCSGLLPVWTFFDPLGDAPPPFVQGVGTEDAQLVMSVPAGLQHEMYNVIEAPHVLQSVNDVDFDLEVKFDSIPTLLYQIQGVLVKQDAGRWMRFDFYSNGSGLRLFAGTTTDDGIPNNTDTSTLLDVPINATGSSIWLNVVRQADQWTLRWSDDGLVWMTEMVGVTDVLNVAEVGLYVGNAPDVTAPPYTMLVDYFFDSDEPIIPEDGPFSGGGPFTLTVDVDPPGAGTVAVDPDQVEYTCTDVVTLTASPNPCFQFVGWSGDLTGNENPATLVMSGDKTVTANFAPDLDAPVLSNISVSVAKDSALVTWDTDEPADSLVDYGLDNTYGSFESDGAFVTAHGILLTGLQSNTLYHYRVSSADPCGLVSSSGDLTFTTSGPSNVTSDDFNHPNLDLGLWTWVDPLASAGNRFEERAKLRQTGSGTIDARLELEVPDGSAYEAWIANGAARVQQPITDGDFELEVKFESTLDQQYQSVGVFVEEDADTWMRFDFEYTGSELRILRASFDAGVDSNFVTSTIQSGAWTGAPLWMRVLRQGDTWTQSYSLDGTNYVPNGSSFVLPILVAQVGPMAGNSGPDYNGVVAEVDYFFSTTDPILDEDGDVPTDATSPFLYLATGRTVSDSEVRILWATDELTTSSVSWGLSSGTYDLGTLPGNATVFEDTLVVDGLLPDTTYHLQVTAQDIAGNPVTLSADIVVKTAPPGQDGYPVFDIWYGQPDGMGGIVQSFGRPGTAQTWVNVLGNVQDPIGELDTLTYSLNGVPSGVELSVGLGGFTYPYRLVSAGDFNIELDAATLLDDSVDQNEVLITAMDKDGHVTQALVWVDYDADGVWPEPYSIDWATVTDLQQAVQIVDGEWEVDPTSGYLGTPALRNSVPGYDRLFAIGDGAWDDFEFEYPVTVHALNPDGYFPDSNSHAIGVIMRWPGHNGGTQQPQENFFPIGGLYAYRWYNPGTTERWQAYSTNFTPLVNYDNFFMQVEVGKTYIFKGRCETIGTGANTQTHYRMKAWEIDAVEPDWLTPFLDVPDGGLGFGSLLFVTHEVEASYGNITITPLN